MRALAIAVVAVCITALSALLPAAAAAQSSAVVFMYHRFGESQWPSTNIRLDQFEAHLERLANGPYRVMAVEDIVTALETGATLPDYAVGLTVDDSYLSVATEAWPRLKEKGFPLTVFVNPDALDAGYRSHMSWDTLRRLVAEGVRVGGHGASHKSLATMAPEAIAEELERSARRFREELGFVPDLFAYPYGEASLEAQRQVRAAGYRAAFGQHSGAFDADTDRFYLPRFSLNETYGGLDRFELAAGTVPLKATDITPQDMVLQRNPPAFGFTLSETVGPVSCFAGGRPLEQMRLEERIELRFQQPFPPGRLRVNCTSRRDDGRWRWFGMQYLVPKP